MFSNHVKGKPMSDALFPTYDLLWHAYIIGHITATVFHSAYNNVKLRLSQILYGRNLWQFILAVWRFNQDIIFCQY